MEYTVAGHSVRFPHQAYGVQLSFMSKVLQTLQSDKNALLEAPTGSGKTLSLLCSALAWQEKLRDDRLKAEMEKHSQEQCNGKVPLDVFVCGGKKTGSACVDGAGCSPVGRDVGHSDGEDDQGTSPSADEKPREKWRAPKIYYATRTHSQIAQVVRELKRSAYRPKMAILASREHYCVNKAVMKKANKDEECNNLIGDGGAGCANFKNTASKMYGQQTSLALQVHDIEDLCRFGKSVRGCPYFAARHYAADADLVFCPYNYLIDPVIRKSMDVDINKAVLIFDEAHNIEDNSREAASAEIELQSLEEAQAACLRVGQLGDRPDIYGPLAQRLEQVASWLKQRASVGLKEQGRDRMEGVWSGQQGPIPRG